MFRSLSNSYCTMLNANIQLSIIVNGETEWSYFSTDTIVVSLVSYDLKTKSTATEYFENTFIKTKTQNVVHVYTCMCVQH